MAVEVYVWIHHVMEDDPDGGEPRLVESFNEAVAKDHAAAVNATSPVARDPDGVQVRGYIKDAWNREMRQGLEPFTDDDFEFVAPPEGWVNPNDPPS